MRATDADADADYTDADAERELMRSRAHELMSTFFFLFNTMFIM